jgi:hypothetical protein
VRSDYTSQKFENCVRIYDQLILISFAVYAAELSRPKKIAIEFVIIQP